MPLKVKFFLLLKRFDRYVRALSGMMCVWLYDQEKASLNVS